MTNVLTNEYTLRMALITDFAKYPIDMQPLADALKEAGMAYSMRLHPAYSAEVMRRIGYTPAGKWQIIIEAKHAIYSVIRGPVSFGYYEIYKVAGPGLFAEQTERYETPSELINALLIS